MRRARRRRIRFLGGIWHGIREVAWELTPEIAVSAPLRDGAHFMRDDEIPLYVEHPVDIYRLERFTDASDIPERIYHLHERRR